MYQGSTVFVLVVLFIERGQDGFCAIVILSFQISADYLFKSGKHQAEMAASNKQRLRLLTYLSPGVPLDVFYLLRDAVEDCTGMEVDLIVEDRFTGPTEGRANPFSDDLADIGRYVYVDGIFYHLQSFTFTCCYTFTQNIN